LGGWLAEVKRLVRELGQEIEIGKVIVFGSRAKNLHLKDSDLDIVIVSKSFEGIKFTDRPKIVYRHWKSGISLEAICLTPDEYEKKRRMITIVREADVEGVTIKA